MSLASGVPLTRLSVKSKDKEDDSEGGARSHNKATARVLRVLSAFAGSNPSFGVTELSIELGMTKNLVFRALGTLVEQGLLVRDAKGTRYELGYGVVRLIDRNLPPPDFRALAEPYIEELHELTGATVQVAIKIGDHVTVIDGLEGVGPIIVRSKLGVVMPLHASAASRAILASLTDAEIQAYVDENSPLPSFTETTITDPEALWAEIRGVRERGYAVGFQDFFRSGAAVAFPILGIDTAPHGAIVVGVPTERDQSEQLEAFLPGIMTIIDGLREKAALYQPT